MGSSFLPEPTLCYSFLVVSQPIECLCTVPSLFSGNLASWEGITIWSPPNFALDFWPNLVVEFLSPTVILMTLDPRGSFPHSAFCYTSLLFRCWDWFHPLVRIFFACPHLPVRSGSCPGGLPHGRSLSLVASWCRSTAGSSLSALSVLQPVLPIEFPSVPVWRVPALSCSSGQRTRYD